MWHRNECDPFLHKHVNIHRLLFFILLKSGTKQCPSQLITWITFMIYYIKITGCPIILLNTPVIICLMAYMCVEYAFAYTYVWGCLCPCTCMQGLEEATLCFITICLLPWDGVCHWTQNTAFTFFSYGGCPETPGTLTCLPQLPIVEL